MATINIKKTTGGVRYQKNSAEVISLFGYPDQLQSNGQSVILREGGKDLDFSVTDTLTINDTPFSGTAIQIVDKLRDEVFPKANSGNGGTGTIDPVPTANSTNLVQSGGVVTYVEELVGKVDRVAIPGIGLEVGARFETASGAATFLSQRTLFIYFRVGRRVTVNGAAFYTDTTAAGATPALVRYGLYAVTEDDMVYPLCRTANDTTLLAAPATKYAKTFGDGWAGSVTLLPERTYALAFLIDTAAAIPNTPANPNVKTVLQTGLSRAKRTNATTELPHCYGPGGWTAFNQIPYCILTTGGSKNIAKTCVLMGDSLLAAYSDWFGLANARAGAKMHPLNNGAVGGYRIDQALAIWDTDVTPYKPDWVIFHAGTNDLIALAATAATVIDRYEQVIAKAAATGVKLLLCTPPSQTAAGPAAKEHLATVRAWMLSLNRNGVVVADTGMALSTGDGVTADAAKLIDNVHPNEAGKAAMADVLDDILAGL